MKSPTIRTAAFCILVSLCTMNGQSAQNGPAIESVSPPPGGIKLLAGYTHRALQGIDSRPGVISKEGGLRIVYEIGTIPKPGAPPVGGQYFNKARAVPEDMRQWFKEQTIGGLHVDLAYTKEDLLLVTFPKSGINFQAKVTTSEELAEALLIILSFRGTATSR